jgi:hypothetical protein
MFGFNNGRPNNNRTTIYGPGPAPAAPAADIMPPADIPQVEVAPLSIVDPTNSTDNFPDHNAAQQRLPRMPDGKYVSPGLPVRLQTSWPPVGADPPTETAARNIPFTFGPFTPVKDTGRGWIFNQPQGGNPGLPNGNLIATNPNGASAYTIYCSTLTLLEQLFINNMLRGADPLRVDRQNDFTLFTMEAAQVTVNIIHFHREGQRATIQLTITAFDCDLLIIPHVATIFTLMVGDWCLPWQVGGQWAGELATLIHNSNLYSGTDITCRPMLQGERTVWYRGDRMQTPVWGAPLNA